MLNELDEGAVGRICSRLCGILPPAYEIPVSEELFIDCNSEGPSTGVPPIRSLE